MSLVELKTVTGICSWRLYVCWEWQWVDAPKQRRKKQLHQFF